MTRKPRKRRNDRNHLVYKLTCSEDGSFYIGVTFIEQRSAEKSLRRRWLAHQRNALRYNKQELLSQTIRKHGPETFTREVLQIVRGKQACHDLERELIQELRPHLNMEGMGRKKTSKKEN
jgi:hypothetical protein